MKLLEKLDEGTARAFNRLHYFLPLERMRDEGLMSVRLFNVLRHQNCHYWGDVGTLSAENFKVGSGRKMRDIGETAAAEMQALVEEFPIGFDSVSPAEKEGSWRGEKAWHPDDIETLALKYFPRLVSIDEATRMIAEGQLFDYADAPRNYFIPLEWINFTKKHRERIEQAGAVYIGDLCTDTGWRIMHLSTLGKLLESHARLPQDWLPKNTVEISRGYFPDRQSVLDAMHEAGITTEYQRGRLTIKRYF